MKYRLSVILLCYALLLGFIQAGHQPFRLPEICAQKMAEKECADDCDQTRPQNNCVAVCLLWCSVNAFNAVTEAAFELPVIEVSSESRATDNLTGHSRTTPPLLPPPKG